MSLEVGEFSSWFSYICLFIPVKQPAKITHSICSAVEPVIQPVLKATYAKRQPISLYSNSQALKNHLS